MISIQFLISIFPILLCFALVNLALVVLGYLVVKIKLVWLSWAMLFASILIVYIASVNSYPILRMLVIIATTFTAMKVIAVCESYKSKTLSLTFGQWVIFAVCWAGMRAEPFESLGKAALPNAWPMIRFGISRVVVGALLILLARFIVSQPVNTTAKYAVVSIILLIGFSLVLHFGMLSISAGSWRLKGVNTYMLFKQPAKSMSLTEFWGKRWNMAFSEMTALTIFRPLRGKTGNGVALMVAFVFSGFLHELALSLPVNSGYGLPMVYFIIQGLLVLLEKGLIDNKISFLQHPILARLWTLFWVIAPAPLLFHTQFIKQIVWPLAGLHPF
jgi:hypothetical protein